MAIPPRLIESVERLDPLPVSIQRLNAALGGDDLPVRRVAEIVEEDQAITAQLLRMANSAAFRTGFPVATVRDAIMRLGLNTVFSAVLGRHLRRMSVDAPLYELTENELWLHSVAASLAVREISREGRKDLPEVAGTAALLHDIGKLIIVRFAQTDVRAIRETALAEGISFVAAERLTLGYDHAEIGAAVARHWRFHPDIVDAIERHHLSRIEETTLALDAVILANLLVKTLGIGLGAEGMNFQVDPAIITRLGLTHEGFCRACAGTAAGIGTLEEACQAT